MAKFIVDSKDVTRALLRLVDEAGESVGRAAQAGGRVVEAPANQRAPGPHVHAVLVKQSRDEAVVEIGPDEEHWYYRFSETGTKPHTVQISQRQALRFFEGGEELFTGAIKHPGMPARPFLRPALDHNRDRAARAVGAEFRRALLRKALGR